MEKKAMAQLELNKVYMQNFESSLIAYDAQVKAISVALESKSIREHESASRSFNEKAAQRNIEASKASIQLLLEQMKVLSEQLEAIQKKNDQEKLLINKIDEELRTKKLKANDIDEFNQAKAKIFAAIGVNNEEHRKLFNEWKLLEVKLKGFLANLETSKQSIEISVSKEIVDGAVNKAIALV
jgi:hypothetical protein